MITPFTFHKTVTGHSHLIKNPPIPCEDASDSYSDPNGRFQICVISDGHGDKSCFRSTIGSKEVVSSVMVNAKLFAESLCENEKNLSLFLKSATEQKRMIKNLTDCIVNTWHTSIMAEYNANPPTQDELSGVRADVLLKYQKGVHLAHIYGATLIAGILINNKCLILLQQGDGRCNVFYEDGTYDQPIPWDSRCYDNVTTSMCDVDAVSSIRHKVINLKEKDVIACFAGSDGVEDSFGDSTEDMCGNYNFYKNLCCEVLNRHENNDDLEHYLEESFSTLSKTGSADDVSVSFIVDLEAIKQYEKEYRNSSEAYSYHKAYLFYKQKVDSMQNKRAFLSKQASDKKAELEKRKSNRIKNAQHNETLKSELLRLTEEREKAYISYEQQKIEAQQMIDEQQQKIMRKIQPSDNELSSHQDNTQNFKAELSSFMSTLSLALRDFTDKISSKINSFEKYCKKLDNDILSLENKIKLNTSGLEQLDASIAQFEQEYEVIKQEYESYEASYQDFLAKRDEIAQEIINLGGTLPQ